jgi:heat shock protein HtpX
MARVPEEDLRKVASASALSIIPLRMKSMFSTHPPLEDRVRRLREMEREMGGVRFTRYTGA